MCSAAKIILILIYEQIIMEEKHYKDLMDCIAQIVHDFLQFLYKTKITDLVFNFITTSL